MTPAEAAAVVAATTPPDIAEALGLTPYEGGDSERGHVKRVTRTPDMWHGTPIAEVTAPPQDSGRVTGGRRSA
ncbi:MAG: hypothetical protein IPH39_06180 [Sulfuritalea sp.]|nr:hypothetical protein [Sulfuritalea sp.]